MWQVWVKQWPKYLTLWLTGPVLCINFVQYLIAFRSRLEVTSNVISGFNEGQAGLDVPVKCGDSRSNRSRVIQLPHFVTNDDNDAGRRTL